MSATQLKYDAACQLFLQRLELTGRLVRVNTLDALMMYEEGAWNTIGPRELTALNKDMHVAAHEAGVAFADKEPALWKTLKVQCPIVNVTALDKTPLIALPNGTLDPINLVMLDHSPEDYTTRRLAVAFDENASCPEWVAMLDRMCEKDRQEDAEGYKLLLQEFFGLALIGFGSNIVPRSLKKMLFLYGEKKTAKSSVADVLRSLFDPDDVATESVDQLGGQFGLENLCSARALISDDAADLKSVFATGIFKKLVTGEPMSANRKNKQMIKFQFTGPVCLTSNNLPNIADGGDAMFDRILLVEFERQFTSTDAKRDLQGKSSVLAFLHAKNEFPGILNWALLGLRRALDEQEFTKVRDVLTASANYRAATDPVYSFLRDCCEPDDAVYNFVRPITEAMSYYANSEFSMRKSPKACQMRLVKDARALYPSVTHTKLRHEKLQKPIVQGMRLNTEGIRWVDYAREASATLKKMSYPLNNPNI